jgi:hypothetical protein
MPPAPVAASEGLVEILRQFVRELRPRWEAEPAPGAVQWRKLSSSSELIGDPECDARRAVRDTHTPGAGRYYWTITELEDTHPVAWCTEELSDARSQAEAALVPIWRPGASRRGRKPRMPEAWLLRLFWEALDRLAYAVMDTRLWLFELTHGPEGATRADETRETDRERPQKAFSEIDISYSS